MALDTVACLGAHLFQISDKMIMDASLFKLCIALNRRSLVLGYSQCRFSFTSSNSCVTPVIYSGEINSQICLNLKNCNVSRSYHESCQSEKIPQVSGFHAQ